MRIGVLGAGAMGGALARRWAAAGHELRLAASRRSEQLAAELGAPHRSDTLEATARWAQVAVLTVGWPQVPDVLDRTRAALAGTVLVDCTNPLNPEHTALVTGTAGSGGELVADRVPEARVVKAFNTVFARVLDPHEPWSRPGPVTVPVCGDDHDAKTIVAALAADAGLTALDVGGLDRAGTTEALALLLIGVWQEHGIPLAVPLSPASPAAEVAS